MSSGEPDPPPRPAQPLFGFPSPAAQWTGLVHGPNNAAALRIAARPEGWATPVLCITGPAKCGLSYLAAAWAVRFDGDLLTAPLLARSGLRGLDALAGRHVAVDDADLVVGRHDEVLLSLINLVASGGGRLLLTAHRAPSQWRSVSPDLKSRLNALPVGEIGPPDDDVLRARLQVAAERRYLRLSPEILNYLVPRLELAYEAVENFMDRLSDAVSEHDRAPSMPLARRVLDRMSEPDDDDDAEG
ncbi:MAG: chromosomal replication initiator DnaA [Hyphomonas sp.]|uniref:DnaA ATPase domain-containing protein n=1 Tax=Hyphomonas sp. TaxID=87 RepID=UPI001800C25A|nr:DnaA/Hda family protein [Hyphomonas sp.]MBU3921325.1 chromosomal replication initiator DnaA [Alphaproteobacteria bacterium]MBA3070074.1 chromosomal replication initiator DnaA [Hyphomonas sp.]MBU4060350.1 chromosomal replication initiator DnaA [Alphaproteobacteria bacterium]MBU4163018.1 chromosomal replication initiator DnaA [Alphaproteobacteria bacterium]MBU4568824.1 chromosomal replication initiator DnaA [Alphaproteobacteria bacterium]